MPKKAHVILCAVVLAYLSGDLFIFNGPLRREIQKLHPDSPESLGEARKSGVIARVGQRQISSSQLERATLEHLWLAGKTGANVSPEERTAARKAAIDELIDHEILETEMAKFETKIAVPAAEIDERLKRFTIRFETKRELETAMKSQGILSEKTLRDRITAQLRDQKFILSKISAETQVSDSEAKKWFDEHSPEIARPERLEARHIFISTSEKPAEDAKKKLEEALAVLAAKQKDFATLAKEVSEDPSNNDTGGNLGWMTRSRLSPDFAEPVFSLGIGQPSLIRTKLGWHLVEVTARKGPEPATFESAKPEIIAALEAVKRRDAIARLRQKLRTAAAAKIKILDPEFAL